MPKNADTKVPSIFPGFQSPNYTPVPDELFDELLAELSGAELKVLLYIIRRTFGFKKGSDRISKSQLENGIQRQDGTVLDRGTGLSRRAIRLAVDSLVERNILLKFTHTSRERGYETSEYALNILSSPRVQSTQAQGKKVPKPLDRGVPTQETVKQETVKQNIDPSNFRKTENEDLDYVNSNSGEVGTPAYDYSTPSNEVADRRHQHTSSHQNGEEIEGEKTIPPARGGAGGPLSTQEAPHGGREPVGQTVRGRLPLAAPAVADPEARAAIEAYIRDIAVTLHDEAPLKTSATRAYNLYQRAGVPLDQLFNAMYDAEQEANRRSATITKLTRLGFKNRMAYFFAVLEDKLGLREKPLPNSPQSP